MQEVHEGPDPEEQHAGRFTIVLPAPRRGTFFWKITFTGSRQFAGTTLKGSTYSY